MQHRGVVAPAEHLADLGQALLRHFLGQIHGDLARAGDVGRALLAVHVGDLDLVVLRHRLLDVLHADLAVLDRQQVAQRLAHQLNINGAAAEARIGQDLAQRAFQFAHVGAHVLGDEEGHVLGQLAPFGLRLVHQDRHAHFQLGRLDCHRQAGIETRHQALGDVGQTLGIGIAGHHDVAALGQQRLEGIEEFFLRLVLAGKELHVVDQQQVERVVARLEFVEGLALVGLDHVRHELFGVGVEHAGVGLELQQLVAHGLQQVRLAQTDAAVDEQRVVQLARRAGHVHGGGTCHAVGATLDQILEGAGRIEAGGLGGRLQGGDGIDALPDVVLVGVAAISALRRCGRGAAIAVLGRGGGRGSRGGSTQRGAGHGRARLARGNRQLQRHRLVGQLIQDLLDARQVLRADPVQLEAVRHFHHQSLALGARLQRADPGVELLGRHILGQHVHAGLPQGRIGHAGGLKGFGRHRRQWGRGKAGNGETGYCRRPGTMPVCTLVRNWQRDLPF